MRGRATTHSIGCTVPWSRISTRLAPILASLALVTTAEAQAPILARAPSQVRVAAPVRAEVLVSLEYGRITIETDANSLDAVLHEIGFPQAFRTGAPLRITFSSTPARMAVLRRLKDANFVVVESKSGRGELRLYPEDQDRPGRLAGFTPGVMPSARDHPRLAAGPALRKGRDAALVSSLRQQLYMAGDPSERARALNELALHAEEDLVRDTSLEMLAREQSLEVLESALEALDNLRAVPIPPLLSYINRERRPELRVQAIEILGRHASGDMAARELLNRISTSREDDSVRRAARSALEDITQ